MRKKKVVISEGIQMELCMRRMVWQVFEKMDHAGDLVILGIQPRGVPFAQRMYALITAISKNKNVKFGTLDPTFHRDDFRIRTLKPSGSDIPFMLDNKHVILVDDVLFTGRTIRSALDALQDFGRPARVELMVLVDRRYAREFPLQPDYWGVCTDTIHDQKVEVCWKEHQGEDKILLIG